MSSQETMDKLVATLKNAKSSNPSRHKPIFWLGAGCSVYDGIPLNDELLKSAVQSSPNAWGSLQYQFDALCDAIGDGVARGRYFDQYFRRQIKKDSPYHDLVAILDRGYADMVFTFNIDDMLEQALHAAGKRDGVDFQLIKVPETISHVASDLVSSPDGPRIRIVKLHGDYRWGFNFMTSREIATYDDRIKELVRMYSASPAIVCGYSFCHLNVLTSFAAAGSSLFYVNRSFPSAPMVLSLMSQRSKFPLFVDESLGCFEKFVSTIASTLP